MALTDQRKQEIDQAIKNDRVVIFSKTYCPYCKKAKHIILEKHKVKFTLFELDEMDDGRAIQDYMIELTGIRTVPIVYIKGKVIGGCSDVEALDNKGELEKLF